MGVNVASGVAEGVTLGVGVAVGVEVVEAVRVGVAILVAVTRSMDASEAAVGCQRSAFSWEGPEPAGLATSRPVDGEVVASAEGYDQLIEQLDRLAVDWDRLIIEYVEPADAICVYRISEYQLLLKSNPFDRQPAGA